MRINGGRAHKKQQQQQKKPTHSKGLCKVEKWKESQEAIIGIENQNR